MASVCISLTPAMWIQHRRSATAEKLLQNSTAVGTRGLWISKEFRGLFVSGEYRRKKMEKLLKRNIRIIYGLAFVHAFMLIVPVLVPFFQSKGLTLAEVFYLQAIYAASIVI